MKKYSGKQVQKAGKYLMGGDYSDKEKFSSIMDILSFWRVSHEKPLNIALDMLQNTVNPIEKSAIFAKRLKRFPSIVKKLERFDEMSLKNMQDIGGCRVILQSQKKLLKAVRELKKRPEFRKDNGELKYKDYITTPKEDGYRGIHMIGKFIDNIGETRSIEVQIRTDLQHDWATALEIIDLFTGQSLKSNEGEQNWKDFFKHISKQFAVIESIHLFSLSDMRSIREYCRIVSSDSELKESFMLTKKLSKRLNVLDKFHAYTQSINIVNNKFNELSSYGYILIEIDLDQKKLNTTMFTADQNLLAEEKYTEAEKKSAITDGLVVALVSTTAVGGIQEAYPNYFADSTEFLKYLNFINETDIK